ncbi:hypothetical protein EDB89DRAFT_1917023 [Lactarius sanguifluus]|nr:hypothetical protein EDB89DRAFT_1917023 [Lactarius sanguifluus]
MPGTGTSTNAYRSLIQDVNALSHKLVSEGTNQLAPSQAALEVVWSAKASLTVVIASANGSCPLLQEERIASNQHSWMETAKSMGAKRVMKCHKVPEDPRPTEEAIGTAKGKRRWVYTDPYTGGERPGRLAKADAVSPAANQKACACTPPPASQPILAYVHLPMPVPSFPASQPIPGPAYSHVFPPTLTFTLASSQPIPPPFSSFPLALGPATQTPPPQNWFLGQHYMGMRNVIAATPSGDNSLMVCSASWCAQDQNVTPPAGRCPWFEVPAAGLAEDVFGIIGQQ